MMAVPREVCRRCRRPALLCYCSHLPSLPTRARVVFLQHPRESRVAIGTARMAQLALPNSELHCGVHFDDNPRVSALRAEPGTALLFPGDGAIDPHEIAPDELRHLIVIDGTWAQARKVLKLNPALLRLPRVGLRPERPGNYRIRREPSPECLATIEAVAGVMGVLERDTAKFEAMLAAFTFMVDQQIAHTAARTGPPRAKRRRLHATSEEARMLANRPHLVFLHAEVNAHARHLDVPGDPELLHLVARRSTGETFEAILAPRRPLAPSAPHHLGLPEERLFAGESIASARARWQAFSRPTDLHTGWGHFSRDQLATEGITSQEYVDLRLVVARRLQSSPGAPEDAVAKLGGTPQAIATTDRAGRVVAALQQVVATLAEKPARWTSFEQAASIGFESNSFQSCPPFKFRL
jgi:DTW domain-containing protein YfiP